MAQTFTMQREYRVYDDQSGDHVSVGMDGDALDLVEIRQFDNGKIVARITMPSEQAVMVLDALDEYLKLTHHKLVVA